MNSLSEELLEQLDEHKQTTKILREYLSQNQLDDIESQLERLEKMNLNISIFGETNCGKSALLNSLFGYSNDRPDECPFSVSESINHWLKDASENNGYLWQEFEGISVIIYDTPGIAGDDKAHVEIALSIVDKSDIVIYVVFEQIKGDLQVPVMREIIKKRKPVIVAINKIDIRRQTEIDAIKNDVISKFNIPQENIVYTAGYPVKGDPNIQSLVKRISIIITESHANLINETVKNKLEKSVSVATAIEKLKFQEEEKRIKKEKEKSEKIALDLKRRASEQVKKYARGAAAAAGVLPFGLDFITSTVVSGGMFLKIVKMYNSDIDGKTIYKLAKELSTIFSEIMFVSAATLALYLAISKGAKTNPYTYILGMVLDAVFTFFIVSAIGHTFIEYCANKFKWAYEGHADDVMKEYIKKNIYELFINKLPKKYRDKVIKTLNPEIL